MELGMCILVVIVSLVVSFYARKYHYKHLVVGCALIAIVGGFMILVSLLLIFAS